MAFPVQTYTSSSAAISDFVNKALANGLVTNASLDANALVFATLANLFSDVPATVGLARTAVLADAGDIPANVSYVELANDTGDEYAAVLPAPLASEYGMVKVIAMGEEDGDDVTMDVSGLLQAPGGDTVATFGGSGVSLAVVGTPAGWLYLADNAVVFSSDD
jgi:hypothetical protein